MPKIIAIGHQKEVGKDQFIKFCIDILRPILSKRRILRRGFADKLYEICHSMYGWAGFESPAYYRDHPECKRNTLLTGKTVRDTLIEVGNKMREYDPLIWINANLKAFDYDILFISDLRFPNEFGLCKDAGATLIRITRPGLEVPTDAADTALNGWEDAWDETIENNDSLSKLYSEAHRVVERYVLKSY